MTGKIISCWFKKIYFYISGFKKIFENSFRKLFAKISFRLSYRIHRIHVKRSVPENWDKSCQKEEYSIILFTIFLRKPKSIKKRNISVTQQEEKNRIPQEWTLLAITKIGSAYIVTISIINQYKSKYLINEICINVIVLFFGDFMNFEVVMVTMHEQK